MNTKKYLDGARALTGTGSDYALAKLLGVSEGAIHHYRTGRRTMDNYTAMRLATLLKIDFGEIVAAAELDREKDEKKRAQWQQKLKTTASYVGSVLLCAMLTAGTTGELNVHPDRIENLDFGITPNGLEGAKELKQSTNYTQWPRVKRLANVLARCLRRAGRFAPGRGPVLAQETFW